MTGTQPQPQYEIGMVGLGVMGRNFLLNMAEHGHSVAGYDKDAAKVAALRQEAENRPIRGAADIKEFITLLRKPRAVMLLVPAGAPVDAVIQDLLPHLDKGDLIIDAGNSHFRDTDVRARNLTADGAEQSSPDTLVSLHLGRDLVGGQTLNLDVFNLLNVSAADVSYYYEYKLAGSPAREDMMTHATEPRSLRVTWVDRF